MTEQETFDFVVRALHKQSGPSRKVSGSYICAYRGHDGRKCAVGQLIPDDEYRDEMDTGYGLPSLLDNFPQVKPYIKHYSLMRNMQLAHDNAPAERDQWTNVYDETKSEIGIPITGIAAALTSVAKNHNISPAVVKELWS